MTAILLFQLLYHFLLSVPLFCGDWPICFRSKFSGQCKRLRFPLKSPRYFRQQTNFGPWRPRKTSYGEVWSDWRHSVPRELGRWHSKLLKRRRSFDAPQSPALSGLSFFIKMPKGTVCLVLARWKAICMYPLLPSSNGLGDHPSKNFFETFPIECSPQFRIEVRKLLPAGY